MSFISLLENKWSDFKHPINEPQFDFCWTKLYLTLEISCYLAWFWPFVFLCLFRYLILSFHDKTRNLSSTIQHSLAPSVNVKCSSYIASHSKPLHSILKTYTCIAFYTAPEHQRNKCKYNHLISLHQYSGFHLTVESHSNLLWSYITTPSDWSKNSRHFLIQSKLTKTTTNGDSLARAFSRLRRLKVLHRVCLVHWINCAIVIGQSQNVDFGFMTLHRKRSNLKKVLIKLKKWKYYS